MAGSREGGLRAAKYIKQKYGSDFYKRTGARGGQAKVKKGFAVNKELASRAGRKGGRISRRGKVNA